MGRHDAAAAIVMRTGSLPAVALLGLVLAAPAAAQTSRIALDVAVTADTDKGSTVRREPGVWFDVFGAFRVAPGLDLVARPVISKRTFDGAWQKQMYQLGVRYERPFDASRTGPGALGFRVDAGQIVSPIGLGILENRHDLNPVVSQHSSYYLPLPRPAGDAAVEIPRVYLIAANYPLGAQFTVAARRWDARVALIDSSPVRGRSFFGANKPPRLGNWIAGAGITPVAGLRLGAAVAYGPYVSATELRDPSGGDRHAGMVQFEGEWSFRYTRLAGEVLCSRMETSLTDAHATGGWIEVTQTLHPRLFLAGRADSQRFTRPRATGEIRSEPYHRYEAVGGFRLTREVTVRAGYMVRYGYVVFHWDDQMVASVTYQKKIF